MPPKARGRGASRARGGARGGASASRSTVVDSEPKEATSQPTQTGASSSEAISDPSIPKDGDEEGTKTSAEGETATEIPATRESSLGTVSASGLAQDGAEPSNRPPVQRLGSLQGAVPPSRSASPTVRGRGSGARGKRGMVKPTFTGRRSKEEREALAKEQREKDSMRNAERDAAIRKKEQDEAHKAKREAKHALRARGGYSGAMSGPFSMGSSREDKKINYRGTTSSGAGAGSGSGSGSRASRVKNEGNGATVSSHQAGGSGSTLKKEEDIFISSDEEDDAGFPRKNIDYIEIPDDPTVTPKPHLVRTGLPVRIGRKEHRERTFGINTEASTEISARIVEQADVTNQPLTVAVSQQASRKAKGKAKDVEIINIKKPFKGVWQDVEDSQNSLKNETITDDENMVDVRQLSAVEAPPHPAKKSETSSPHMERTPKVRTKSMPVPALQTEEDRAEWQRFLVNQKRIRSELGPEKISTMDATGDTIMGDEGFVEGKENPRDNMVYLFQIPSLMPELVVSGIKKEHPEMQSSATASAQTQHPKPETKIKVEEGNFSDPAIRPAPGPRFTNGLIGKLRVRQSGRTTLDWGGTSYELTTSGKGASFLQEVVSVKIVPEKDRMIVEEAGEAVSLGRVKGKFIVVPDWENVLG